jgi:cell division ATPase FtsA
MSRPCSICIHKQRNEIDNDLNNGNPVATTAKKYGVSKSALLRHRNNGHVLDLTPAEKEESRMILKSGITDLQIIRDKLMELVRQAEISKSLSIQMAAIKEWRELAKLLLQLSGELDERPQVNVGMHINIDEIMGVIVTWIDKKYPKVGQELREHVVKTYSEHYTVT